MCTRMGKIKSNETLTLPQIVHKNNLEIDHRPKYL